MEDGGDVQVQSQTPEQTAASSDRYENWRQLADVNQGRSTTRATRRGRSTTPSTRALKSPRRAARYSAALLASTTTPESPAAPPGTATASRTAAPNGVGMPSSSIRTGPQPTTTTRAYTARRLGYMGTNGSHSDLVARTAPFRDALERALGSGSARAGPPARRHARRHHARAAAVHKQHSRRQALVQVAVPRRKNEPDCAGPGRTHAKRLVIRGRQSCRRRGSRAGRRRRGDCDHGQGAIPDRIP